MQWIAPSEKDPATPPLEKRLGFAADQFRAKLLPMPQPGEIEHRNCIEANKAAPFGLYTCVPPHPKYKVIGPGVTFGFRLEGQRGGVAEAKPAPSESIKEDEA